MKKLLSAVVGLFLMASTASAMSHATAQSEALFLTDKMAYELGLSAEQYEAVYEINYDYLIGLSKEADILGAYWTLRNTDLGYVLSKAQFALFKAASHFYKPVLWKNGAFSHRIYTKYATKTKFYYAKPSAYSSYKGAHAQKNNKNASYYKGKTFNQTKKMTQLSCTTTEDKTTTTAAKSGDAKARTTAAKQTSTSAQKTADKAQSTAKQAQKK